MSKNTPPWLLELYQSKGFPTERAEQAWGDWYAELTQASGRVDNKTAYYLDRTAEAFHLGDTSRAKSLALDAIFSEALFSTCINPCKSVLSGMTKVMMPEDEDLG